MVSDAAHNANMATSALLNATSAGHNIEYCVAHKMDPASQIEALKYWIGRASEYVAELETSIATTI